MTVLIERITPVPDKGLVWVTVLLRGESAEQVQKEKYPLLLSQYSELGLQTGEIDEQTADRIAYASAVCRAYVKGLTSLSYGDQSARGLTYKLEQKGSAREHAEIAVQMLSDAGYGLTTRVLDASRCGVPQKRQRFFLIGKLGEVDGFLDAMLVSGLSNSQMTVRDYLGDRLQTEYYYMHPRSYNRRAVFSVDEPASTIRGINRPIPENYKRHPADKAAVTDGVRALTTRERGYIQTFPDTFSFPGAKTDVELAIGNAVPPALAKYVAECIKNYSD